MKREVAGPVPFWMSEIWNIRGEKTRGKGRDTCRLPALTLPLEWRLRVENATVNPRDQARWGHQAKAKERKGSPLILTRNIVTPFVSNVQRNMVTGADNLSSG